MNWEPRPISPVSVAVFHRIAASDTDLADRIRQSLTDPADVLADRWQLFRLAERDAWKAVELLLLRKGIRRRFREGTLDAWVTLTPFGEDILSGLESFFGGFGSPLFPVEPANFTTVAFQELRAARLAGELYRERPGTPDPVGQLASVLQDRFPHLASVVRHPELDVAALARCFLGCRLRANRVIQQSVPFVDEPPASAALADLASLLQNWPELVEELIGDCYAEAELNRRLRLATILKRSGGGDEAVSDEEACCAVVAQLGRRLGGPDRRRS